MLARGEKLPSSVDFTNQFIYYVGSVDPVRDEIIGPACPTTATRMDKFTEMMLAHDRQARYLVTNFQKLCRSVTSSLKCKAPRSEGRDMPERVARTE
jgi:tartrate dehydratase beta subunit/fumarate hydratase class I family protein